MPENWDKIIVIDTETTGTTSPSRNQILTIDAVFAEKHLINGHVRFVKTGQPFHAEVARQKWALIEPSALAVNGIDIDSWKGVSEAEVLGELVSWVVNHSGKKGYILPCGYNIAFDKRFLHFMFERNSQFKWTNAFSYRMLDVMQLVMWAFEFELITEPKDMKLETVSKHLGVWMPGAHDSSVDVELTLNVLNKISELV